MIHRLTLGNFKPFRDTHEAPLAPITLVYGPNSAGKSALLQSLLLMKQTFGITPSDDPTMPQPLFPLRVSGRHVDLGSWASLIFSHEEDRSLEIGLVVPWEAWNKEFGGIFVEHESTLVAHRKLRGTLIEIRLRFLFPPPARSRLYPFLDKISYRITPPDRPPFAFSADWIWEGPMFEEEGDPRDAWYVLEWRRQDRQVFADLVRWLRDLWKQTVLESGGGPWSRELRRAFELASSRSFVDDLLEFGLASHRGIPDGLEGPMNAGVVPMHPAGSILGSIADAFLRPLDLLLHLGPVRRPPSRVIQRGVAEDVLYPSSGHQNLLNFCEDPERYYDRLDHWLEALEIPYRIRVRRLPSSLFGDMHALVLHDVRTGVEVAPTEVGFGIAQVLPLLLQGIAANQSSIVSVEQPELHLHPRLQAHLADFFIETAREKSSQWIIETHSEALMLRLQRRIREGKLSPDDVAVLYVEPGEEGSRILHLRLAEDGEFIDEWPEGFFEERYDEMFGGEE